MMQCLYGLMWKSNPNENGCFRDFRILVNLRDLSCSRRQKSRKVNFPLGTHGHRGFHLQLIEFSNFPSTHFNPNSLLRNEIEKRPDDPLSIIGRIYSAWSNYQGRAT